MCRLIVSSSFLVKGDSTADDAVYPQHPYTGVDSSLSPLFNCVLAVAVCVRADTWLEVYGPFVENPSLASIREQKACSDTCHVTQMLLCRRVY
jgi:hypothetical protein